MSNKFYNSGTGINWSNVGDAALGAGVSAAASGGVGALFSVGGSLLKGLSSSYFNKQAEKRSYQRMLQQMGAEYQYAQRYAENSPSWTVKGLRDAGINPILAFSSNAPSSPSVGSRSQNTTSTDTSSDVRYDPLMLKQIQLLDAQIDGQNIRNNNEKKNMGLSGRDATYARIFNEVKDLIGDENFSKLSTSTLDSIKSLFDSPDNYSSLFSSKTSPFSIPDTPILSEDTPPSMAVYTDSRPSPKPYSDSRSRPKSLSIAERFHLRDTLRKRHYNDLRRKSKKTFHFNDEFEKFPNWRRHFYR